VRGDVFRMSALENCRCHAPTIAQDVSRGHGTAAPLRARTRAQRIGSLGAHTCVASPENPFGSISDLKFAEDVRDVVADRFGPGHNNSPIYALPWRCAMRLRISRSRSVRPGNGCHGTRDRGVAK
jgi:hypothetical protein